MSSNDVSLPTAPIRKGDLTITMKFSGDVKAMKSVTLYAPFSVTDVKLLQVAKSGTMVKTGDMVVLTGGVPVGHPGNTNFLKVHQIGQPLFEK